MHRREEAIRGWRNWLREDPLVHPCRWLRPDLVPPAPFFASLLVVLEFWLIRARLMRNSVKLGFPTFAVLGKGRPVLRNSLKRLKGGSLFCLRFPCLVLTGEMLAEVVHRKGATAGSLDGWGWREFKALPISWFDGLLLVFFQG